MSNDKEKWAKWKENSKTHTILQPKDCDCKNRTYPPCPICDDGLAYCTVCHGGESELEEQSCQERQALQKAEEEND